MKLAALVILALCLTTFASAQTPARFTDPANLRGERVPPLTGRELPIDKSEAQGGHGIQQLLRKLNTRASLLLIVAHPDDEDGGMVTLNSRGLGARVAILTLNRGEGGQNAMTGDFEDALGLIRTQELLSADRYLDAGQMFGTEVDFGFSKTKEESFAKWGRERVLYDAVRAVRLYRPLVIASVFIGGVTDGHGQHQVSGEIAQEAFAAAADPTVFPDMIAEGILPWQALKVYARVPMQAITARGLFDYATGQYAPARFTDYVTGQVTTTAPSVDVVLHESTTDPLLTFAGANPADLHVNTALRDESTNATAPLSYVQFARIGLSLQRTQIGSGMRLPGSGPFDIGYHLYGSVLCESLTPSPTAAPTTSPTSAPTALRTPSSPPQNPQNCHPERSEGPAVYSHHHKSCHPERRSAASSRTAVEGPAVPPTAALPLDASNHELQTPASGNDSFSERQRRVSYQPGAQPQGNALGTPPNQEERAEGPIYNPALVSQPTFFDGIDTSIEGIATLAPNAPAFLRQDLAILAATLSSASTSFDVNHPESTAPFLAEATVQLNQLLDRIDGASLSPEAKENVRHELLVKRAQLNDALALALGLRFDATAAASGLNTDTPVKLTTHIEEKAHATLSVEEVYARTGQGGQTNPVEDTRSNRPLAADHPDRRTLTLAASETLNITRPYFFRDNIEQPVYRLREPALRNAPATPPALVAWANVDYKGVTVALGRVVHAGDQPISFVPPLSLTLSARAQVLPLATPSVNLAADVQSTGSVPLQGRLLLSISPNSSGWTVKPSEVPLRSATSLTVATTPSATPATLAAVARTSDGDHIREGYRPVGYPGLIYTNDYTPATDRIVPVDLKLPTHRRIAYLPGTGDAVPEALASIGLKPEILTVADLTPDKLKAFDTVILGVRTYNAHPDLHGAPTQALLDYARGGGNVVVQYQTAEFTSADAPYPLTLGYAAEKVVDESATVSLLAVNTPLRTVPNTVTSADFNGWVEERGHGFLGSWDPRYTAPTETHDPGQQPQRGGLITAQTGRGHWTYCAFALYRQLPEAVPGAYRLFVNLLGLADQR